MITKVLMTFVATMILYFTYKALFGKCNRFTVCRVILLAMSIFAFVIPFISIKISGPMPEYFLITENIEILNLDEINVETENVKNNSFSLLSVVSAVYIIGVIFSMVKMSLNIYKIYRMRIGKKFEMLGNVKIVYTNENHATFSFFNNIFIPDDVANPLILKHELSHVRNRHSLDIILMEIMISLQWFNPFIYMMKKELQSVHEYIADEETVENETDKSNYMMLLLQQCTSDNYNAIANNFSFLLTKKRIIMITQKQKTKRMVIRMLLTLPVFALLVLLNTQCDNPKSDEVVNKEQSSDVKSDAQMGRLLGTIVDIGTGATLPSADVVLIKDDAKVCEGVSSADGKYEFDKVPSGTYELKATLSGYKASVVKGLVVPAGKIAFMDLQLTPEDTVYNVTAKIPEYPGGAAELMKFISSNIKYPQSARANNIEGRVFVSFVVEKDGSITNAQVMRGIDKDCDAEALRVVTSMPKWSPGLNVNSEPVRCKFIVPIYFKLNNKE